MDTGSEVAQVECTDVPQSEPISEDQVPNNAGGFVYTIDDFSRLKRFVILGSNANNYYVSSKDLGLENCECVLKLLAEGHGVRVVEEVTRISREGRAPRQSTGIMVLAICARLGDLATRRAALAALPAVCRTASTLFELVQRCKELGPVVRATRASWGRSMRRAIALWYLEKSSAAVAYQATKYSQRCGWSHVDLLRLAHPDPEEHAAKRHKLRLAAAAAAAAGQGGGATAAIEAACAAAIEQAVSLIRRHRFGHEHVGDTALLRAPELWAAFLEVGMPLTALVRNLGRMTQMGLMERPDCLEAVTRRLRDGRALAAARVHPMTLLEAMCTYRAGAGARGVTSWKAKAEVKQALEEGFYLSFKNVTPTGQRYLIGMDVSGSMCCACAGMTSVTSREAAAAMAMTLVRTDPCKTMAFSHQLVPLELQPNHRLEEVVSRAAAIPMGGTDCALPMLYALERKLPVDVFVVLTDNETWFGKVHPSEALKRYRAAMGLPAKLVVLAFSATNFSIADPRDAGMLDVAGLDSAVPQIVADFAAGRV
ncbi:hypothetical protein VOLCADRAFT_78678 [Volvox carteri f. nagariensis]|uniref:TROVE domain-containing protein n=1 Tax=Volvox carteri f. nagariensis TaxID=3068 RepID=D8THD5_VOLCA|nr:uncharacterized protein VOLCADRAFT_78678 [Volvox carteri f. nagariensis]EFJ53052.1 hypothetical protein VOLCADRAFT_78678 [Volvox carteri f. nagariensis]|eukprot:XP_002946057.1 hypothetical protein VOLCADRAFT_78678 [Volvox carteri f. nagariensis]